MNAANDLKVTKRDGRLEPLDLYKIHRVINWAAEGLDNVSVSQVELKSHIQFYNGIRTDDIHETIIKAAADLISQDTPDYQYLAARLAIFHLRKIAYGEFEPPHLFDHVSKLTEAGKYDRHILADYSREEFEELNDYIDHERDMTFSYGAVKQLEGKYLVQNRVTRQIYETPQFLYILVAMCLFAKYPKATRLDYVKRFYDAVSTFKISLPTPIMSGVRTPTRQFSSCVLIECDDSLDSINATTSAIVKYVSQRAGIGINAGRIRGLGSEIRGGEAQHTGCIPFFKMFQAAVKSCSQGGVRGGAATLFYPLWHIEVESLLVLKNNRGVEDNRVRHLDYGVQINRLLYTRLIKGGNITLFSPNEVPGLYEAFFADQDQFECLYTQYEQDPNIRKRSLPATELFSLMMQERAGTGRIYIQNVDHCNTHSPFDPKVAPVRQSNLCLEIALPTKPLNDINDENGEIALCTLSAFNLGALESLDELEGLADLAVRALDALLDYQDYPVKAAKVATMNRRTLGIGVINYAYYLAKNGVKYSDDSAIPLTHRTFEAIQYYLLKASVELAKEFGACPLFNETTYAQGKLPIDTYKKDLDAICQEPLHLDWESLRADIVKHGLRNSTLTALMPSETSSQIANATNGIEPPRGLVSVKASKDGILKQVVPEFGRLKNQYELLWQMPSNDGYLKLVGIMQKFVDQAISANTSYDPQRFEGGRVPMKQLLKDLLTAYKFGLKTLYYHNTRDGADDTQTDLQDDGCVGGACKI
ncbi:class 1a ribonucleoside-diphosphate reductase subunit alpha [Neisseria dumasiana]|uniref:Ribonucleoside-diphosphate reductase n=1 Tax=Neisseria dumasiana TaxID=1931275 RepID=A0ABX3WPF0_9NEIS|nr:class 1a ribonucleoside-diphosphate reductase subunit alpha [Neisseria dumasiana]OSI36632.1 ribonucleoside-diphosphate reductase subunit alpha [Neisseria dumasiana]UOO85235.1 ribonucleoside-diphosphate reductase subunit alpha [Neisseria dumasiana]